LNRNYNVYVPEHFLPETAFNPSQTFVCAFETAKLPRKTWFRGSNLQLQKAADRVKGKRGLAAWGALAW
jgi:hypothetical protein